MHQESLNIEEVKNLINDWKIGTNPIVGQYYYNSEKAIMDLDILPHSHLTI